MMVAEIALGMGLFYSFMDGGPVLYGLLGILLFAHSALFMKDGS